MMKCIIALFVSCVGLIDPGLIAAEPLGPENALKWKPKDYPEATLYPRIPFLSPDREWERMDIWVPKTPATGKLPCVVAVYGGGYGDKSQGFINDARPLLKRGFVVAAPDYALRTNAPVPLCSWDVANAIRFLRANAATYRIDPERIGFWGWSAGGWIAQDLCYHGPERLVHSPYRIDRKKVSRWLPVRQPRPQFAEQSVKMQAVVTDWGAGKLWDKRRRTPQPWLSPDDPPLFTCFNGELTNDTINPVTLLQDLGVPARGVYGVVGNTHVPKLATAAVHEDGTATTWGDSIFEFFERELKHPTIATAPEMIPHGGPIHEPTDVRLLTVHNSGTIHYTLDGSDPRKTSPTYQKPVRITPGQTLKAIVVRDGLKPSRVTTGNFLEGPLRPTITTKQKAFTAEAGQPFSVQFQADNTSDAHWTIGGKTGEHYREYEGQRFNPPRHVPWMAINADTGELSGTPRNAGVYPVIVACVTTPKTKNDPTQTGDAIFVVITVTEPR